MAIKIQFETRYDLSGYEGIVRINNLSFGIGSPDSFKWECDLEWARGKDIPVKQLFIFSDGAFLGQWLTRSTLGYFVERFENEFLPLLGAGNKPHYHRGENEKENPN